MKVDEKDWQQDLNFATSSWGSDNSITLYIALQEGRLKDLVEIYTDDFESVLRTKSTTRRFSAILLPANHIVPPILASRFNFRYISNLHYPQPQLTIHWDMASIATKGQVYVRLGHIKELYNTIETERQGHSGCGLPEIRNIVICITIPWEMYSQWTQGKRKHHGLDALWEQGILATLPVMVKLADGTEEPHVWCRKKTKRSADRWSSVKTVHAIFQEVRVEGPHRPLDCFLVSLTLTPVYTPRSSSGINLTERNQVFRCNPPSRGQGRMGQGRTIYSLQGSGTYTGAVSAER